MSTPLAAYCRNRLPDSVDAIPLFNRKSRSGNASGFHSNFISNYFPISFRKESGIRTLGTRD